MVAFAGAPSLTDGTDSIPTEDTETTPAKFSVFSVFSVGDNYTRRIEGKECIQLIYTNGISTISLFEQAVGSKEKFQSGDFREYVMYSQKGGEPVNIIGWNSAEVSFTLIGEEDFSHLMGIIRAIQEGYLGNR